MEQTLEETNCPLIPMSEITDEARKISVAWMECEDKNWIGQKHKLASDIMNYSNKQNKGLQNRLSIAEADLLESKKTLSIYATCPAAGCDIALNTLTQIKNK